MAAAMKQAKKKIGGPYLSVAVFCDSVLRGEDGAMSAIRIVDHITITVPADAPPDVPSEDKRVLAQIEGLIGFKKGDSRPNHQLKLVMNSPSGNRRTITEQAADFKDETHGGYHLRIKTTIAIKEGGLFWMDVYLDGKKMTRMPLLITVKRAEPDKLVTGEEKPEEPRKRSRSVKQR